MQILNEISSDFGLELYCLARQIQLLATTAPDRRSQLFVPGRHVAERRTEALHEAPPAMRTHLRVLMRLTSEHPPARQALAEACDGIGSWALEQGHTHTGLHFSEASALIAPTDPHFNFVAGRSNRLLGDWWRAEIFYVRAIRFAQRKQDWNIYVRANLGLGRLHADRGHLSAGVRHYFTAARSALDQGHRWLAAQTFHDLFPLYYEMGDREKAFHFARRCLGTYPCHHELYPLAVHDFLVMLVLDGHFDLVWPLLLKLTEVPLRSQHRVAVWGTLARTAGNLGFADYYAEAEARILELAPHYETFAPWGYLGLAYGARALDDVALAFAYVEKGLRAADSRIDRRAKAAATDLLRALESGEMKPPPVPPLTEEEATAFRSVADAAEAALTAWRAAPTWTARENQSGLWRLGIL